MIEQITDEIIALTVAGAGTILAGWVTYTTGEIPEFCDKLSDHFIGDDR